MRQTCGGASATRLNRLYCRIRDLCATNGCSACQAASRCDQSSSSVARQLACRTTQEMCRLDDYRYEIFTRAFLNGCGQLAKLPEQSLLLHAPRANSVTSSPRTTTRRRRWWPVVCRPLPLARARCFPLPPGQAPWRRSSTSTGTVDTL